MDRLLLLISFYMFLGLAFDEPRQITHVAVYLPLLLTWIVQIKTVVLLTLLVLLARVVLQSGESNMHDPDGNMDPSEQQTSPAAHLWTVHGMVLVLSQSRRGSKAFLSRSFDEADGKRSLWSFKPCMHRASSRSEVRDRSGGVGARPMTHLPFVRVTGVAACV